LPVRRSRVLCCTISIRARRASEEFAVIQRFTAYFLAYASGYQGQSYASGYQGQSYASGYQGQSYASGYQGQSYASGYQGQSKFQLFFKVTVAAVLFNEYSKANE